MLRLCPSSWHHHRDRWASRQGWGLCWTRTLLWQIALSDWGVHKASGRSEVDGCTIPWRCLNTMSSTGVDVDGSKSLEFFAD